MKKELIKAAWFALLGAMFTAILFSIQIFESIKRERAEKIVMSCEARADWLQSEIEQNQEIINYLYEQDMRGEIKLDASTIFLLGRIK